MTTDRTWNLFVRTLQELLAVHGMHLHDLERRIGLHHEKVRRLLTSAQAPKSFPTLNPEEMDRLHHALSLTTEELVQLKAALLATAIEDLLMDRIRQDHAWDVANAIQPILEQVLRQDLQSEVSIFSQVEKGSVALGPNMEQGTAMLAALQMLDRAVLALHLSREAPHVEAQVNLLRQAISGLITAGQWLDGVPAALQAQESWPMWRAEVRADLLLAQQWLDALNWE